MIVSGEPILSWRSAKNFASTMIISTFAISLNWKQTPKRQIVRWAPSDSTPIASTAARRPNVKRYASGANVPSQA